MVIPLFKVIFGDTRITLYITISDIIRAAAKFSEEFGTKFQMVIPLFKVFFRDTRISLQHNIG